MKQLNTNIYGIRDQNLFRDIFRHSKNNALNSAKRTLIDADTTFV